MGVSGIDVVDDGGGGWGGGEGGLYIQTSKTYRWPATLDRLGSSPPPPPTPHPHLHPTPHP